MKSKILSRDRIIYVAVIIFAAISLYFGNMIASRGMVIDFHDEEYRAIPARVSIVHDIQVEETEWWSSTYVLFQAELLSGESSGQVVRVIQDIGSLYGNLDRMVEEGDRVLLWPPALEFDTWYFAGFVRTNYVIVLGVIFAFLLIIFGRIKGVGAILALGFTCTAIFAVFIPAILSGANIYLLTMVVCVYSIIVTLFILYGVNLKSLAAVAGCFGGVLAAGIITLVMNNVAELTGVIDTDSLFLLDLPTENPIDLRAIIFAGIIIGAVGAIMDVAVSVSSALWELKTQAPQLTFKELFKSGVNIGRDIMGSMTNTLVLAYIGSSLSVILLLIAFSTSFTELLNRELVIVEILQAIIGSLGILFALPLTALVCAVLYSRKSGHK